MKSSSSKTDFLYHLFVVIFTLDCLYLAIREWMNLPAKMNLDKVAASITVIGIASFLYPGIKFLIRSKKE